MSTIRQALTEVIGGQKWDADQTTRVMRAVIEAEEDPVVIGGLLVALQTRGLDDQLLCAAVQVVQEHCRTAPVAVNDLIDCCGTGGDGLLSFNISTAAALIAASGGARVSKHGNRSASGRYGSADVLAAVGVDLERCAEVYPRAVEQLGFGFLYAPWHHQVLAKLAPIRKALGVPTLFNLTGPLLNPSSAPRQLLGTFSASYQELLANSLLKLGRKRAWVVRAEDGLDELSTFCLNRVIEVDASGRRYREIDPKQYGLGQEKKDFHCIQITDLDSAVQRLREALSEPNSPPGRIACLNASAVLYLSGVSKDMRQAVATANECQASGRAAALLDDYVHLFAEPSPSKV